MMSTHRDPILVVLQLTGGNDYLNTIVPFNNPIYYDNRPSLGIPVEDVLPINGDFGFNPAMNPIWDLYNQGKVAVINGIGYPNPNRSHFRSMDIWHTCEPEQVGTEGWLGRVIRDLDPNGENVLTGVNFGRGLPRSMALPGIPVASVSELDTYGVLTGIKTQPRRDQALDAFAEMYAPAVGTGSVMDYLGQTGLEALKGADILSTAPRKYHSTVEYSDSPIGRNLQGIAKVLLADLGTRIFNTQHIGYDTHANQGLYHLKLWTDISQAITDFYDDLRVYNAAENVLMFVFTEFGRRIRDNGAGTDHGSGGVAFAIGDAVKGGMYGGYPSLKAGDLLEGDLRFNFDYRGAYGTLAEKWLGLDPVSIVGGNFEQLDFL